MSALRYSPTAHIADPHLKKILRTYALTAMSSLSGPGAVRDSSAASSLPSTTTTKVGLLKENSPKIVTLPTALAVQPGPIFSKPENGSSELFETDLEGHKVHCFLVGGEKRLCLPQVLNTVLSVFSLQDINAACDDLHIYVPPCSSQQLNCLKQARIIPNTAPSCSLITNTDAQRLCAALLLRVPDRDSRDHGGRLSIPVEHRCFGRCEGMAFLDLLTSVQAPSIQCSRCHGLFTPSHFVLHNHMSGEPGVCHWGFDAHNWRHYIHLSDDILLSDDVSLRRRYAELLEQFKQRFQATKNFPGKSEAPLDEMDGGLSAKKRIKVEDAVHPGVPYYSTPVGWFYPGSSNAATVPNTLPVNLSTSVPVVTAMPAAVALRSAHPSLPSQNAAFTIGQFNVPDDVPKERLSVIRRNTIDVSQLPNNMEVEDRRQQELHYHPRLKLMAATQGARRDSLTSQPRSTSPHLQSPFTESVHSGRNRSISESAKHTLARPSYTPISSATQPSHRSPRSVHEADDSSSSTVSADHLGRESGPSYSAPLNEDSDEEFIELLNHTNVDWRTRTKILDGVKVMREGYRQRLAEAEKSVHHYKFVRKEKIRELKRQLQESQQELTASREQQRKSEKQCEELSRLLAQLQQKAEPEETNGSKESSSRSNSN